MRRASRLLEEGCPAKRIALFSFTRTAARDLQEKVVEHIGESGNELRASTIHSYCFSVLAREDVLAILDRNTRILLDHEVDLLLRDLPGDFGDLRQRRDLLHQYEAAWATDPQSHPGTASAQQADFVQELSVWLKDHSAMLVGEVVPLTHNFLRTNPTAEALSQFDHVIVDEYQDLNKAEQAILEMLVQQSNGGICIAGDDDQSIYGFRYAHVEGIHDFRSVPNTDCFEINVCGRCPQPILSMANSLISHAPNRTKPPLTALATSQGTAAIVQWASLDEEIEGLAAAIAAEVAGGRNPGEILVLATRRKIGEPLAERLRELEIPAVSYFQEQAVQSPQAREALAVMQLLVSEDAVALRVFLSIGASDGRSPQYSRLRSWAHDHGARMPNAVRLCGEGDSEVPRIPAIRTRWQALQTALSSAPSELPALVDHLLPEDVEAVATLRSLALSLLSEHSELETFVPALVGLVSQQDVPSDPEFVRVMSLHKSKGLTSPSVYITGVTQGLLPSNEALSDVEVMSEQRRLFYVAITRASESVVISGAARLPVGTAAQLQAKVGSNFQKSGGITTVNVIASPFIGELGQDAPASVRGRDWLAGVLGT
jgi:superfamily I DNA/RNA helicase